MYSYSGIIYDRATLGFIYQGGGYNARVLYIPPLPLVEESGGVFVVHIESNDTENEEKDGEGQSNSVQKTDSTDVVAVANWRS